MYITEVICLFSAISEFKENLISRMADRAIHVSVQDRFIHFVSPLTDMPNMIVSCSLVMTFIAVIFLSLIQFRGVFLFKKTVQVFVLSFETI